MKKIKFTFSIAVLLATMAVIGMSGSQVALGDEMPDCNCVYPMGVYGIICNNDCIEWRCRPWVD